MHSRIFLNFLLIIFVYTSIAESESQAQLRRRLARQAAESPSEEGEVERARTVIGRIIQRRRARLLGTEEESDNPKAKNSSPEQTFGQRTPTSQLNLPTLAEPQLATDTSLDPSIKASSKNNVAAQLLPTQAQMVVMDNRSLLNTTKYIAGSFDDNLTKLTTAEGWQRHLVEPLLKLQLDTQNPKESEIIDLQDLLTRFDKVSANPAFAKVNQMPSFIANHTALSELASRYTSPSLNSATSETIIQAQAQEVITKETLPVPVQKTKKLQNSTGERSILKRD